MTLAWHDGMVDAAAVQRAAAGMLRGGVVGMPTETVYGLAARARHQAEVAGRKFFFDRKAEDIPFLDLRPGQPQWHNADAHI